MNARTALAMLLSALATIVHHTRGTIATSRMLLCTHGLLACAGQCIRAGCERARILCGSLFMAVAIHTV
jgi:hypothetical protein